jgi:hypothetical protein
LEVLSDLLESERAAAILGESQSSEAEEKALRLISRLEEVTRPDSGLALAPAVMSSTRTVATAASVQVCPWEEEDSSGYSQATG